MRRRTKGLNFGKQRKKFNVGLFKEIISWIFEMAIIVVIAYTIVAFFGFRTSVVGNAMSPTLKNEEQVLVNKFVYLFTQPKSGDIVVFLPNGNEKSHYYVRRVIAGPGDTVLIEDGAVYVNGELYDEATEVASIVDPGLAEEEITLGTDEYFVLGDNRNSSEDSRMANIGNISKDYIVGKAWFYFTSVKDMGFLH
ncbi:MAG: signal peptidase I [Clostridiales bacterium]|nr:signal peptidase I [Clostridiales bacterium]